MSNPPQPDSLKKRRPLKFVAITLLAVVVLYVGIHGALRGWELQRRLICASNLKGLGTSSKIYSTSAWDGQTPIIDWLAQTGQITAHQTKCPGASSPNYILVIPSAAIRAGGIDNRTVIAYEPKENHGGEGGNILFADGHASFVRVPGYDELIEAIPKQ